MGTAPPPSYDVRTVDYHTAGEPFRIVLDGAPEIPGSSVRDRREHAPEVADEVRRLLCHEPRGHADMYGCFLVPPDDEGADLGVLFWHKDGYSTACGHGTIALGAWAVESGRVEAPDDGDVDVVVDVPSGRVTARVHMEGGAVQSVGFRNVPSYVLGRDVPLELASGTVRVDVGYGGAIYASVPASSFGLTVTPDCYADLIRVGREVKWALDATPLAQHPDDPRLSGVYGTILFDDLGDTADGPHQRNVTVFADGEVDRSPCGSGTSARVALLADEGRLEPGQTLLHESIVGTRFTAQVVGKDTAGGRVGFIPEVRGMAYRTGEHRFVLDPRDPVGRGFVLR
ncbi:MAG TPA: proline racemase family protein [Marmoricola sp.]|nr:proline racemase family protein [Marmoricola sp.]